MRCIRRCVGLGLVLALMPAAFAQDKKADADKADKAMPADKNAPKDKKEALEKMHVAGQITGKLTQWGGSDKGFTVQVTVTYPVLNDGEYRALAQAKLNLLNAKSRQDLYNANVAIMDHQSRLYTAKKETTDVHFVVGTDMKVRTLSDIVIDDKGKARKANAKQRAEMKGPDKTLPGYTADIGDVHQDSYVTVYVPKKKPGKTTPAKDEKGLTDNKPEAIMIVILGDVAPAK